MFVSCRSATAQLFVYILSCRSTAA